ncbi:MAG TPA: AAA family ATPase, partial [Acidimicrobiales bacterium]|nr:AAA family ATPase [Acidimicrobiales bacterium]
MSRVVTSPPPPPSPELAAAAASFRAVEAAVAGVVFAPPPTIRLAVGCLAAGGHLLVEDHPGLGKTTLAKSLAAAVGLGFRRLQCTADLLPADVTGATILGPDVSAPVFRPGPVFTNVLMADELNRASPRAQSALLEAMEERQVTVDGTTYPLPRPFFVLATQNPYDAAGTAPLPHGQRDRFLVRIS